MWSCLHGSMEEDDSSNLGMLSCIGWNIPTAPAEPDPVSDLQKEERTTRREIDHQIRDLARLEKETLTKIKSLLKHKDSPGTWMHAVEVQAAAMLAREVSVIRRRRDTLYATKAKASDAMRQATMTHSTTRMVQTMHKAGNAMRALGTAQDAAVKETSQAARILSVQQDILAVNEDIYGSVMEWDDDPDNLDGDAAAILAEITDDSVDRLIESMPRAPRKSVNKPIPNDNGKVVLLK